MNSIGLDIGTHSIKLVELRHTTNGVFLNNFAVKELPLQPSGEESAGGVIAEKIKELFQEKNIKAKKVTLGVSGPQVALRRISLPSMPKKELKEALRWEARKFISFPIEDAIVDFQLLGEIVDDGAKQLDLMVSIAGGEFIENQVDIVKQADLKAVGLGTTPHALWHCMQMIPETREGVIALIDIGSTNTNISLAKDNRLQLTREIATAGNSFTEAIKEAAASEGAVMDVAEVEEVKKKWGIPGEEDVEGPEGHISLQKISFAMRPQLERLLSEIKHSFDFHENRFKKEEKIRRIYLSGGGARLKGLKEYIADQLGTEVRLLSPFRDMSPTFAIAVGLALGRGKEINLLPEKYRLGLKIPLQKYSPVVLACLVFFVLFGIFLNMDVEGNKYRKELTLKKAELAGLQSAYTRLVELQETKNKFDTQGTLFPGIVMEQPLWREIFKEISQIIPQKITLTGLALKTKDKAKELRLKGVTFGEDARIVETIVETIKDLEKSPLFSDVRLFSSEKNNEYNKPGAKFELGCTICF